MTTIAGQLNLAAWEHELRGARGRWVKAGTGSIGGQLGGMHTQVAVQRAQHATEGDLRLALIKSQVYTRQEVDRLQDEISRLQAEQEREGADEAKAVLVIHLAWIGAGIAVALLLTGVGIPPAIALLIPALPSLGSEFSELAVVLGKGREHLAHPAAKFKALLHRHRPHFAHLAGDPLLDQAAAAVAQWLTATGYTGPDVDELAHALVDAWAQDNAARLAGARQGSSLAGQLDLAVELIAGDTISLQLAQAPPTGLIGEQLDLAFNPGQLRDRRGRWARGPSIADQLRPLDPFYNELPESGHRGTVWSKGTFGGPTGRDTEDAARLRAYRREHPVAVPITADQARGNSRPVSYDEFQQIAARGLNQLAALSARTGHDGLTRHWDEIKGKTYPKVLEPWGGATIDSKTGSPLESDADRYALSVKPQGLTTVSIPEGASEVEFSAAMDQALAAFGGELDKQQRYLGVFHDDDNHRIDIDPVLVVGTPGEVEAIGAYTHAIGGAYHFRSGDGYWPPHVAGGVVMAGGDGTVHFDGPGQWRSQADAGQPGLSDAQLAQIADAAGDQDK